MKTHHLLPSLAISTLLLCSCEGKKGTYQGSCTNLTFGGAATLSLEIGEISSEKVSGSLSLKSPELVGGGTFTGQVKNGTIIFRTHSHDTTIVWVGKFEGNSINGTYSVPATLSLPAQHGTWSVSK